MSVYDTNTVLFEFEIPNNQNLAFGIGRYMTNSVIISCGSSIDENGNDNSKCQKYWCTGHSMPHLSEH